MNQESIWYDECELEQCRLTLSQPAPKPFHARFAPAAPVPNPLPQAAAVSILARERAFAMMLRQIEYFLAVVNAGSFSVAAERCHISQSAVSQQIKALETELGVSLLSRHNRTFSVTPAGELFYRKGTVLVSDVEQLKREVARVARPEAFVLRLGYLKPYAGPEFRDAVAAFSERYPDIELDIRDGNHEDLYDALRREEVDLVMNDQRRAFSDNYVNLELARQCCFVEIAAHHPFAKLPHIDVSDLKNLRCILVAGRAQRATESTYYHDIVGFTGEHLFAETLAEARIMVASGRGYLPVEGARGDATDASIARIPLMRRGSPVTANLCAFWKQDNSGYYVEEFAQLLKQQFGPDAR